MRKLRIFTNKYSEDFMKSSEFGNWKVLFETSVKGEKHRKFQCKCVCGKEREVLMTHLRSGKSKGCGCIGNYKFTHNLSEHPLYFVWLTIKQRCYNKNKPRYKDWGGRGIIMCDEWKNDFKIFYDWSMKNGYEKGLQIDREDNDGNYEPSNCRYVTSKINNNNRRNNVSKT